MVANSEPFQSTAELVLKLLPFTVRRNDEPPGATEVGFNDEMAGPEGTTMGNASVLEVPVPGLFTAILALVAVVNRFAGTVALSCVEVINVVGSNEPFQRTAELVV